MTKAASTRTATITAARPANKAPSARTAPPARTAQQAKPAKRIAAAAKPAAAVKTIKAVPKPVKTVAPVSKTKPVQPAKVVSSAKVVPAAKVVKALKAVAAVASVVAVAPVPEPIAQVVPLRPRRSTRRASRVRQVVPVALGSLTQPGARQGACCQACGSTRVTSLALTLTDGTPVEFTSCHACEHRSWYSPMGELDRATVLDKTRKLR